MGTSIFHGGLFGSGGRDCRPRTGGEWKRDSIIRASLTGSTLCNCRKESGGVANGEGSEILPRGDGDGMKGDWPIHTCRAGPVFMPGIFHPYPRMILAEKAAEMPSLGSV